MGGQTPAQQSSASRSGLLYGAGAYIWWGLCPGFFLLLLPAGAPEVLAHRIVWSALLLLLVLAVARRLGDLRRLPRRTWLQLLGAAVLISVNWGTYIFAVTTGHVVDAALGYFINPLVSVLLGVLVFRERINRWQAAALVLALVAVVILTVELGAPPYIAVVLALSFGVYGLIKKVVRADPRVSVAVETLLALPFAAGYVIMLEVLGQGNFLNHGTWHALLLLLAGPVTAVPLLLFAAAAQRLPMVDSGSAVLPESRAADGLGCVDRTRTDAGGALDRIRTDLGGFGDHDRRRTAQEAGGISGRLCRSGGNGIVITVTG